MKARGIWEPYFKPTARVHDSGFRCFECGYLQIGDKNKAAKKVVIATMIDHIMFSEWLSTKWVPQEVNLDLLKSGEIRIYNLERHLYWSIPGSSDACITTNKEKTWPAYKDLDEIWKKQSEAEKCVN